MSRVILLKAAEVPNSEVIKDVLRRPCVSSPVGGPDNVVLAFCRRLNTPDFVNRR